jgi:hypothetical protein
VCVFENRVLRGIFGPKGKEVTINWRELHNEEHHLYSSQNIISVIRWAEHVTRALGEMRSVYRV